MGLNKTSTIGLNKSNSRFTGNVKLMVNSTGNFWLNSINRNMLNSAFYEKFPIYKEYNYGFDVARFFNRDSSLEKDVIYENEDNSLFYAGPRVNENPVFSEKFSYFAPLWLVDENLPDYFVVFKLNNYEFFQQLFPTYNYHSGRTENFEHFKNNYLFKSEIAYIHDFTNSDLGEYLRNSYGKIPTKTYEIDEEEPDFYRLNGIDLTTGAYSSTFAYVDDQGISDYHPNELNEMIINLYKDRKFVSGNIINLEFLFDSSDCSCDYHYHKSEYDYSCFYGLYLNTEEISRISIDLKKHNEKFSINIPYTYSEVSRNDTFKVTNVNGVNIYIDKFLDSNFEPNSSKLYFLKDRQDFFHNIFSYSNKTMRLTDKEFYVDDILGIQRNNNIQIPSILLSGPSKSNIKLTLNNITNQKFFDIGDYLSINPGIIPQTLEWRVIAAEEFCCGNKKVCYYEPAEIKFTTNKLVFTKKTSDIYYNQSGKQTIQLESTTDGIMMFEEGEKIRAYWNDDGLSHPNTEYLKYHDFVIHKVVYDYLNDTTTFTIIDIDGEYFGSFSNINKIKFVYKGDSYYYTYFDPVGSASEIVEKLTEAFNSFDNKLFVAYNHNNELIIESKWTGDYFDEYKFNYNFTETNTSLLNFKINDVSLTGTNVLDCRGNTLFNVKRKSNPFIGNLKQSGKLRFLVEKTWASNINGDEVITTRLGRKLIDNKIIEDQIVNHSNYIGDWNIFENYYVYQVDSPNDDIYLSSTKTVSANYQFYPIIVDVSLINTGELK